MVETPLNPLAELKQPDLERFARVAGRFLNARTRLSYGPNVARQRPGSGQEFLDHHAYVVGDDLRRVDWRLSVRSRQPQVRRYQNETHDDWFICLDRSASMGVSRGDKWALAIQLTAVWSYLLLHLGHRVGLMLFSANLDGFCPLGRGRSHYVTLLKQLQSTAPVQEGGASQPGCCADRLNRANPVIVISDFLAEDGMLSGLARLGRREIHALQVLSTRELVLPEGFQGQLRDVENKACLSLTATGSARLIVVEALHALQRRLTDDCRKRGISLMLCNTGQHWRDILTDQLRRLGQAYA